MTKPVPNSIENKIVYDRYRVCLRINFLLQNFVAPLAHPLFPLFPLFSLVLCLLSVMPSCFDICYRAPAAPSTFFSLPSPTKYEFAGYPITGPVSRQRVNIIYSKVATQLICHMGTSETALLCHCVNIYARSLPGRYYHLRHFQGFGPPDLIVLLSNTGKPFGLNTSYIYHGSGGVQRFKLTTTLSGLLLRRCRPRLFSTSF